MIRRLLLLLVPTVLLATSARAQAPAAPAQQAPTASATTQDPIKVTVRTDPPIVAPGGWVDVVAAYEVEKGKVFTSPHSPNGPRTRFDIIGPKEWRRNSTLWTLRGQKRKDPVHGDVVDLGGRGGMRLRFHVPETAAVGKYDFTTALTLALGDGKTYAPETKIEGATSVQVAVTGARGPELRNLDNQAAITDVEKALLAKNGFMVRANAEFAVAQSNDVVCVALDILVDTGVREDALSINCDPEEMRYTAVDGWRAFRAEVGLPGDKRATSIREVMPIAFADHGVAGKFEIPVQVTMRTTRVGDQTTSQMATQAVTVNIEYTP